MTVTFRNYDINIIKFRSLRFMHTDCICQFKIILWLLFRKIPTFIILAIFTPIVIT